MLLVIDRSHWRPQFNRRRMFTVAAPTNSQNDRFYVCSGTRKKDVNKNRLLPTRPAFRKSVMVSVGVSKLGCTTIHFAKRGVKVNGEYYRNNLLGQKLLPDMRWLSQDEFFCVSTGRRSGTSNTRHHHVPGAADT